MEQPTIGCDYPDIHNAAHISSASTMDPVSLGGNRSGKPLLLRRVSQSDPHLDIPHFVNGQEKSFSGFHHVLSGLIEGNSSLNLSKHLGESREALEKPLGTNMTSSPDLCQKPLAGSLDRNKSALELSSQADPSLEGLRKSSSVANYNLAPRDSSNSSHSSGFGQHLSPVGHFFGQHLSQPSHHTSISTIPEDQADQGLMMSVRPSGGIAANALNSAGGSARQGLMDSAAMTTSSPPKSALGGVMGNVFGRGFFAKPVLQRSPNEDYRYIMALDRN